MEQNFQFKNDKYYTKTYFILCLGMGSKIKQIITDLLIM